MFGLGRKRKNISFVNAGQLFEKSIEEVHHLTNNYCLTSRTKRRLKLIEKNNSSSREERQHKLSIMWIKKNEKKKHPAYHDFYTAHYLRGKSCNFFLSNIYSRWCKIATQKNSLLHYFFQNDKQFEHKHMGRLRLSIKVSVGKIVS